MLFVIRSRKQVGIGGTSEQRNQELNAYTPIDPQAEQARYDGGGTMILQHNGSGNEENIIVTEAPGEISEDSMELPPPFDTISTIDDMELPNDVQINSNGVPC